MEQGPPSGTASGGTLNQAVNSLEPNELESENLAAAPRDKSEGQKAPQVPAPSGRHNHEIKRNTQEHTCPYCLHPFVHLSNYRKHIREACLLKKKKNKRIGDCNEAVISMRTPGADDSRSVERADCSSATNVSLKEPVENSVINMLRNQSKQVELIGAQAAAVKDQPSGATNQSPPNFMTFSCTVCHKIFLSYVKMLQHRLSHKLQTDEPPEKTDVPDAAVDVEVSSAVTARHSFASGAQTDHGTAPAVQTEEKSLNNVLMGTQDREGVDSSVQEELGSEDPNCIITLAELDSLPDDDDDEGDSSSLLEKESSQISPQNETKAARAIRKRSAVKRRPRNERTSSKDIVQRKISGRALKTTSRCQH